MSKLSDQQINEIVEKKKNGIRIIDIAKEFNLDKRLIARTLVNAGLVNIDEHHPNSKINFTEEQELDIIHRYKAGERTSDIGKTHNVSASKIDRLIRYKNITRETQVNRIKYHVNEDYFDEINSEEKAYMLGFIYTDGCNQPKFKTLTIEISIIDKYLIDRFAKILYKEDNERNVRTRKKKTPNKDGSFSEFATVSVYSDKISKRLIELGVPQKKSRLLAFPKWLDKSLYWAFLRGCFDGDGCVYLGKNEDRDPTVGLISSDQMCEDVQKILFDDLSIRSFLSKSISCPGLSTVKVKGYCRSIVLLDWMYKNSTIHLHRKFAKYQKILANSKAIKSVKIINLLNTLYDANSSFVKSEKEKGLSNIPYVKKSSKKEAYDNKDEIVKMYNSGLTIDKISEKLGLYRNSVDVLVKQAIEDKVIEKKELGFYTRKYNINHNYFDNIDNEEKAYILGFFFTTGSNNISDKNFHIGMAFENLNFMLRIRNIFFAPDDEYQVKITESKIEKTQSLVSLCFFSNNICQKLKDLSIQEKDKKDNLIYPKHLFNNYPNLERHFIRGIFDGSCCISVPKNNRESPSVGLITTTGVNDEIKRVVEKEIGVEFSIRKYDTNPEKMNMLKVKGYLKTIKLTKWLYSNQTICLERRYNKYLDLMEKARAIESKVVKNSIKDLI